MKTVVIIPAYNEEKTIGTVLANVKNHIPAENIIVIDDGSKDRTPQIADSHGVHVYTHKLNRGLGGALGTGLEAGKLHDGDIIVTMDADEQHDPAEIKNLIAPIEQENADVVIGSRLLKGEGMPLTRKGFNWVGNVITWTLFGIWTTDSQSGFRAFSYKACEQIKIRTNKMEVSSEIIKEIKRNRLRFEEVPIKAIYTQYSMSKGQNFFEGIKTVTKLVILRFRK
ncbi:glycosyltransferase family 2 protein [Patescibacteria group bacterium]|nr:glycosyltransferase family 2 protein [Patescibacteria group bacterium]MBU1673231.1 glycosyltransferase family 2 protein [Patescibacteria group bacterium]MBU1964011.1 glycosyltransferase family 2 protein [Patescibacteria group bacterium]